MSRTSLHNHRVLVLHLLVGDLKVFLLVTTLLLFLNVNFFAFSKSSIICCDGKIVLLSIGFHWMITQKIVLGRHGRRVGRVWRFVDALRIFG